MGILLSGFSLSSITYINFLAFYLQNFFIVLQFPKRTFDDWFNFQEVLKQCNFLPQSRILMEMNYMLSYGAAERSLLLLKKFHLLDILLPFHVSLLTLFKVSNI